MRYKHIIFDLDGTLIDSIDGISYSMNKVLLEYGYTSHSNEVYITFIGNGRRELVKKALPEKMRGNSEIDKCNKLMEINYKQYWDFKMKPFNGILEVLKELENRQVLLSVNTNKDSDTAKLVIERFFPNINFRYVIGNNASFKKKPDPEGVHFILEKSKTKRSECLYVGDSEVDIETAKNAGINSISVTWGYRPIEQLKLSGVNRFIGQPEELLRIT